MNKQQNSGQSRVETHSADYTKKRHVFAWILSVVAVFAVAAGLYSAYVYFQAKNAVDKTYDSKNSVTVKKGEFNGKHSFAVLLLGTDTGALDRTEKMGNTDTIIVAVVNPKKKRYSLISIPRDTLAQMVGAKSYTMEKINAAYSIGGAKMAMKSVSKLINVPIKYYALVNMGGLMKMIRYVGGINIKPLLSFEYSGYVFKKGKLTHMGGAGALAYSRMRYEDPEGDYGRQKRQRQVITALVKKAVSLNSLSNLSSILKTVSSNVKTNLPFSALQSIVVNYRSSAATEKSDYLHGYSTYIDEASYQVMATKELQRISNYVRKELGLQTETISNAETYQNKKNIANGFKFGASEDQTYTVYSKNSTSSQSSESSDTSSRSDEEQNGGAGGNGGSGGGH
ncbi:LCP family protein [Lactobacillus corticis]|uniref:LytR family transcriptional regulator n=1 Tax=Lactobacillus corticis TaxID=2201249 RepID=A0A916VHQ9_9LACO|nr:LCP family protein [Lactobacillus corticis]GFZ26912.1 LytR family transcriptional regulator [Lactobacillus corticis]